MTPQEKQQAFLTELKALLAKYDAEIVLEEFGRDFVSNQKMVVDFNFNEAQYHEHGTGLTPQLILGTSVDAK